MALSNTATFSLTVNDVIQEAYDRIGGDPILGYDVRSARRSLNIMFSDWAAKNTPYRDYVPYLTSKAAIDFMTRAFAVELAPHGILVNAIAPGPTIRPRGIGKRNWEQNVVNQTPLTRESSAQDISEMVITLLKSETITGETIHIDSGRHLAGPSVKV